MTTISSIISENLKLISIDNSAKIQNELTEIRKMILGLIRNLENKTSH